MGLELKIDKCCCLFNLRDGSLSIGLTLFITSLLNFLANLIALIIHGSGGSVPHGFITGGIFGNFITMAGGSMESLLVGLLVINLMSAIIHALLVYGVYANRNDFVLVWLILFGLMLLFFLITVIVNIGMLISSTFGYTVIQLLILAVLIYWWLVVYCFRSG